MICSFVKLQPRNKMPSTGIARHLLPSSQRSANSSRTLPLKTEFHGDGVAGLFVHGSPTDPLTGYIYPDSDLSEFSEIGADVVFMGHTHHPFVRQFNRKLFVNVGSCGLPRGQDLRGSVCIFDVAERRAQIIRFDISKCCERILSQYSLSPPVTSLLSRCVQYTGSSGLEE